MGQEDPLSLLLVRADARRIPLRDGSVDCVVTSPPYWSLRDYGVPDSVWGGDHEHAHEWVAAEEREAYTGKTRWQHETNGRGEEQPEGKCLRTKASDHNMTNRPPATDRGYEREPRKRASTTRETRPEAWGGVRAGSTCACGAWMGVLGLEPTVHMYVGHLVEVFREVRRVLKPSGTLWLNLGDCYQNGDRGVYRLDEHRWERSDLQSKRADRGGSGLPAAPNRTPQVGLRD